MIGVLFLVRDMGVCKISILTVQIKCLKALVDFLFVLGGLIRRARWGSVGFWTSTSVIFSLRPEDLYPFRCLSYLVAHLKVLLT